ncbi:MAG: S8/S53 family peptidase [Weeksellaceae bacterium]
MKKLFILSVLLTGILAFGQEKVNRAELLKFVEENEAKYEQDKKQEEIKYADHRPGEEVGFQGIFDGTPNYVASDSRNQVRSMNVDSLNYLLPDTEFTGNGFTVYIWDGGRVRTTHQEFTGRAVNVENSGTMSGHATGVGGVIISEGISGNAEGIASQANLKAYNFTTGSTTSEMAVESNNPENEDYMVSNHSYGSLTGWNYNTNQNEWYWYGYPHINETESILFGKYQAGDRNYDLVAFNAPQHSIFKSSGNNQGEGPGATVNHYALNSSGGWEYFTGVYRPDDCEENDGYDCLAWGGSVAKNMIMVGAIKPMPPTQRYEQPSDVQATAFTSFGPTDDGRIKPEVVAIGQSVNSPNSSSDTAYSNWSGTSFSSPAAAGVGLLMQQVKNDTDGGYIRGDMMKALLVNSAFESGDHLGPDYKYGYGLINAVEAARTILNTNENSMMKDLKITTGNSYTASFVANGNEPIKATIAWLDPPPTSLPTSALNDRTPMLVNDLDLRITSEGTTYYPWKLDPDNPAAAATQEDNTVDNLEQVYIENPIAGQTYTLTVTHKGSLRNDEQYFALVVTGIGDYLGTKDLNVNSTVTVYPNPVKDNLNIKFDKDLGNVEITLFDIMGRIVYSENFQSFKNNQVINMNQYPAGTYLVYIKSDEGIISKKLIKN